MFPTVPVEVSGERFQVIYHLTQGSETKAYAMARELCLEQTVELSENMLPNGGIRDHVAGHIESLKSLKNGAFEAVISFAVENSGFELLQLLNVAFGNSSMKSGIKVIRTNIPECLLQSFPGPRFGGEGIRILLDVPWRPLLGTALKPVGYPAEMLADYAYQFALGGLDVIKDDHGLTDQPYAPFKERARECARAVQKANEKSGGCSIYIPNISGPIDRVIDKAIYAQEVGAGGVELCPGLVGFDMIRILAADDRVGLPIFAHPSMLGTYVIDPSRGLSYEFLYGQLMRLAGVDGMILAGYGGRFPTTKEDCRMMIKGASEPMGHLKPILPMPGGGMTIESIPEMLEVYGQDVILLISGGLFSAGPDLVENCHRFREAVESAL